MVGEAPAQAKSHSAARASATRSVIVIVWLGGQSASSEARSAHVLGFLIVPDVNRG